MGARLGLHFQNWVPWAKGTVRDWYKWIVPNPAASDPAPHARCIGRIYIPDPESDAFVARGAEGAEAWYQRCLPFYDGCPWVYAWEGPNEPGVASAAQRAALTAFTSRWVQLMHARPAPLRTVALSLSVGWPDVNCAPDLAGALEHTDFWGLHEYAAPAMRDAETWLCLRYRRTVAELRAARARIPPLLITECGIDGGVIARARAGWRSFATPEWYLSQLKWYQGELARDAYVQAAFVFGAGPAWEWADFEVPESLGREIYALAPATPGAPPLNEEPMLELLNVRLVRPLAAGVGAVSQWFGQDKRLGTGLIDYSTVHAALYAHNGLDYAAPKGTPVLAAHTGRCHIGWDARGYGNFITLREEVGDFAHVTLYAHLNTVLVTENEQVEAGRAIGTVGSTGNSTGPHLHFGWKVEGVTNPGYLDWLNPLLGRKLNGDA